MSALLKIVQGPNAGAEIALPDGIEITLGKADTCDIVLADPTLPDAPLALSATAEGVTLDGTPLEPLHVRLFGSTAFAVGPSDTAWPSLVWPAPESPAPAVEPETGSAGVPPAEPPAPTPAPPPPPALAPSKPRRSLLARLLVPLAVLFVAVLLLVLLLSRCTRAPAPATDPAAAEAEHRQKLADFATRYNLTLDATASRPSFTGNFATRAERLEATARLYEAFPGAALDLTDDESIRTAVADSLYTLGESALSIASVSDRTVTLAGATVSPATLSAAIEALRSDIPRLTAVEASSVTFRAPASAIRPAAVAAEAEAAAETAIRRRRLSRASSSSANAPFQVCGILSTPYPCLVLQNGARVFPGATLGGSVVQSITPDSVVLATTNGTFTWKP